MAHGRDTEELLKRFANYENGLLNVSNLDIFSIPPIPKHVTEFDCSNTSIRKLPNLPNCIEYLNCSNTKISKMQNIPKSLKKLNCSNTKIIKLPHLGENLEWLNCENCPLILPREVDEDIIHYKKRNNLFEMKSTQNTYRTYREELGMIMNCIERLEKLAERHSLNVMYS
jgi:hypothetical protein